MGDNHKITVRSLTDSELDNLYGNRKVPVGKCFKGTDGHLYKQMEDEVLHLNIVSEKSYVVNTLHAGFLNDDSIRRFVEIDPKVFSDRLSEIILKLSAIV